MSLYNISVLNLSFSIATEMAVSVIIGCMLTLGIVFFAIGFYKLFSFAHRKENKSIFRISFFTIMLVSGVALIMLAILIWADVINITSLVDRFLSALSEPLTVRPKRSYTLEELTPEEQKANDAYWKRVKELDEIADREGVISHIAPPAKVKPYTGP
ncbi:hypothetical protein NEFER03_0545 [Nematocida sp. LUAm3]|nr:hypothetical protein NEFER03_0545 [Nematocida sp. LUAm3]KAI5175512.1 hypothetical protein NEFER02_1418 [Nematocida sp. LUAm2]KAI5178458.1 hypothetical protein NEFER01_1605 [Nematocida sp. LUAm1]